MHRFVAVLGAMVALTSAVPANIFEIDISPEEAQRYLSSPPFTEPQLAGRTAVLPLVRWNDPSFRTAEAGPTLGHYWKNGKEIENTNDYVEEVYDAAQYHGQDGLGAYGYGYQTPESSKVENRARSGDVQGSYTYKSGNDDIKVRYWADSEGFHQEDNLPKVVLEPVKESEDVRQARLAHEKAWNEAAAAAAQNPDPQGEYSAHYDQYQSSGSAPQGVYAAASQQAPVQAIPREGKAYGAQAAASYQGAPSNQGQQYQGQYQGAQYQGGQYQGGQAQNQGAPAQYQGAQSQAQYQGAQAQGQYQSGQAHGQHQQSGKFEEAEPTGPPRGFFYSFNYPVSILKNKNEPEGGAQGQPQGLAQGPHDYDSVYVNSQSGYGHHA